MGRETREAPGFEVSRIVGREPQRGLFTYYGRFDPGLVLGMCARVGAGTDDPRVADLVGAITNRRGRHGLWEYAERPGVSRWITYDLLYSLCQVDRDGDWLSREARTPFTPYPKQRRRY